MTDDTQSRLPDPADEHALFDAYSAAHPDTTRHADVLDLAAWIDGTLDSDAMMAVETRMAHDPHARELVSIQRLDDDHAADTVQDQLLNRLYELQAGRSESLPFQTHAARPRSRSWWTSTAAAAGIMVAIAGFLAGRFAATESYSSEDRFLATATFNVFDDDAASTELDDLMFDLTNDIGVER